jgi:hypothetical protein
MRRDSVLGFLLLLSGVMLFGCTTTGTSSGTGAGLASTFDAQAYLGTWHGQWSRAVTGSGPGAEAELTITSISSDKAEVTYGAGSSGMGSYVAKVGGGGKTLSFETSSGRSFSFHLKGDKVIGLVSTSDARVEMRRVR